jgi:alcohol dehydrogenase class IV
MNPFVYSTARTIVFGPGRIAEIGGLLAERSIASVLIVTDPGVLGLGLVAPALESLEAAGIAAAIYADVSADPVEAIVLAAARHARETGAQAVFGIGGGSSLDVAKRAAVLAATDMPLSELYGIGKVRARTLPLVLAPTTAGTGSEVTPIAIVTTSGAEKMGIVAPALLPDIAILDPELTYGLPPAITAATGIDAMVHAIESYTSASPNNNPLSRLMAREALGMMWRAIGRAVHDGADRAARSDMLFGAMLAGQAFANSPVAAVHALAYPLGGHFHVPHGLANALVLPHVIAFNAPVCGHVYDALAREAQLDIGPGTLAQGLAELASHCGLPVRLRDVGIPQSDLEMLAADAMKQTRLLVNNPRPLVLSDALDIYRTAW